MKLEVNHKDDLLIGSLQPSDSDSKRQYGSINLSIKSHNNSNGNGSVRNSVCVSHDNILESSGSRNAVPKVDQSSLPRKNPRYHAIKKFEEAQSKLMKSRVGVFDIGL